MAASNSIKRDANKSGVERIAIAEQENASDVGLTKEQAMLAGFDEVAADKIAQIWLNVKSRHDALNQ